MANGRDQALLRHVRTLFEAGTVVGLTERQLLERFASGGDEVAFEALMTRVVCVQCRDNPWHPKRLSSCLA